MLSIAPQDVQAQTAAGTEIDNVASAVYRNSVGTPIPVDSNLDRITVIVSRTPSTLIFLKYGAGLPSATPTDINPQTCSQSGDATGPFVPSPGMTDFAGNPIDLTAPVPLVADGAYHAGEPVFLRLEDQDQNLDPAAIEMVDVVLTTDGGDRETLRLSENGPNTGIFYGYIMSALPPPAPGDCRISVAVGESIRADYTDIVDGSDASSDVSLVDPFGVVFDSTTGAPIDGAEVTLWDVLAGAPANPIGDDGLSSFPATIISGGTATDSSGQTYDFDPGRFRFPFVMPGRYELRIVPPATHSHPSVVSTVELQNLPGGPYAIVPGSRGEEFVVPVGPAVQVDIPLDPAGGDLLITKQAGKQRVGGGEFVPYRLRITNGSGATIVAAELVDRLPARFRYEQDSAQITGGTALEPTVSRNGTELVFALGDLAANDTVELQYVARVATGAKPGDHINRAFVQSPSGARSNVAEAVVQVEPDLFDNRAYLMGRIHIDACDLDPDEPAEGLGGVKVYLEDGSFVLTDDEGRYHFEAISAGTHVVQVDLDSIPDAFEMDDCEPTQRRAGRTFSEFVEVRPGTLWRSDFHVRHKVPANGALSQEFSARIEGEGATTRVEYALKLAADRVDATGLTAMIRLPDALEFEAGSAIIEDEKAEASAEAGPLVVRLDRIPAGETRTLRFHATLRADAAPSADEMLESTVIVRARPAEGKAVSTPPAKLRFPIVLAEAVAPPEPVRPAVEPPVPEAVPSAAVLPAPAPVEKVLKHRLLHRPEGATSRYALQIFVDEELPDVILAEVDLPAHQSMVDWSPRNEIGTPVTTIRNGSTTRFILPRHASRRAVRVFLMNGQPQRVLQVFFRAKSNGAGTASATSRVLPSPMSAPAARADRVRKDLGEMPRANTNRDSETARSIRRGSNAQASGKRAAATGGKKQDTTSDRRAKMAKAAGLSAAKRETATTRAGSKVTLRNENSEVDSSGGGEDRAAQAEADLAASAPAPIPVDERFGPAWLASAAPGRSFIYPEEGDLPRIPSLKIGVQHEPSVKVELTRNGEPISPANFDGRIQNTDRTSALSRWRGVGLEEGENELVAIFRNPEGAEVGRTTRTIHLAGAPVRAKLVPEESTLIADGRTPPVVALRLFDRWGMPVREGATGQFDLDPPYQTKQAVDAARTEALAELGFDRPSFVVEEDGIARIQLHPTSVVGDARLRFQFREEREDEIRAWLEPGDREWVLVGLATGTVGWNHANEAASGRDSRRSNDVEEGVITEGRVAFFAKGRVPGDFLLTAAYDTDASNTRLRDRLFQTLEPDEHYTLYGDTTQRDFDAPTSGALYVKIERKRFYALYGDYQTGLEETELSRYSRSLTGAKLEYRGEHFEANAFVTDSDQSFVMDEIPGDGTSGLYRLSRQEIVAGSETVTIETRDRFRPEIVLSEEPQARFTDYDIDYRDGTIFFRRPIAGQDDNFDPIFIVVDYETNDRRDNAVTGGGRLAARALDGRVEVGFTGIHESGDQIESQLFGGDVTLGLGPATELRAEFAHTQGDDFVGDREGNAWLVEVDHRDERVDVRAYAQEQESEFGLGQQRGTNGSLRSYGIDAGFDWTGQLRSETSLFRQENLDTDAKRNVAELRTRWERGAYGMNAGVRYAGDDNEEGSNDAVQVLAGGRTDFFDGAISLRAEGEAALMEDQFGDFPYRALVGGDWRIHERLSFFVDQEFTFGDEQRSADTRAGFRGAPWKGASVTTTVNQENREFGPRTYANLGLQQRFDLSSKWGFDLSLDRTATIRDPGNPSFRVGSGAPAASGSFSDDYTAVSVGTAYREELWSATGRLEARFGENEDRWGLIAGFLRDTNEDLSWSAKVDLFYSDARSGAEELRSDTSLSLAYRPLRSHWIVLDRLDFEYRDNSGGEFDFESRRLLHHFKANQLHGRRTQIAWQLSNKLIVDTINGQNYTNFGTLVGTEMRRDFATGWDMSMHARVRHQTSGDEVSVGYGLSVGRILVDNVWLSLGYNLVGFYDDEFSGADYTAQGPYFRIRAKFDQLSVKEALKLFR